AAEKFTLGPREKRKFQLRLQIAQPGDRKASLILRNPATGQVFCEMAVPGLEGLNPVRAYLDRSYYTIEATARAWVLLSMSEAELAAGGFRIAAALLDGKSRALATGESPASAQEVPTELPLGSLAPGNYGLKVELLDRGKAVVGVVALTLRKHAPAPTGSNEVKIDHENRCLLLNGKPFFPVGICAQAMDEDVLKSYQDAGFNALIRWWGMGRTNPPSLALETLDAAHRHGLYMIDQPLSFVQTRTSHLELLTPAPFHRAVQETPPFLQAARRHPALLMYYGLDEAPGSGPVEEPLRAFLDKAHELDPYHPVYISGGEAALKARYDFADILGDHTYWCPLGAPGADTPNTMARSVREMVEKVSEPRQRPLFVIPQSEITSWCRRPHGPKERRINVYVALIHGAKAILYFAAPIQHRLTLASMKELSAELHALAPTLLTRTPPQHIAVEPTPAAGELPIVQAVLKDRPEGGALLIAGNSSSCPVDVKWDLSGLGDGLQVADFFSQKAVPLSKGVLTDRFDGYGTRVYLIQGGSRKRGQKALVRLTLSGEAVERLKQQQKTPAEPPRLNLLASPSFEEEGKAWTIQGKGMTFAAEGRNGSRCLKVSRTNPREVVNITAEPVTLKPNTRYRFGGWVKSRLTEGQQSGACYLNDLGETPRVSAGIPFPPTHGEWRMVSREIPTPDGPPVKAKFWYQVAFGIAGDIWIDDVFVEEVPPVPVEAKPKNVIINSSFEAAAVPGWPDSWFFGTTKPGQMIGDPGGPGQDAAHAYHGKHSLKIANPFDQPS
ncbi:MAG: hypothetical protein FJ279_29000, partial [Planctomycetes bacterium]|nr:hypothetical protein [Planctomycetota bacterium]